MRLIDTFFSTNAGITLYHYTSIDSLVGIAEANKVWASNVYYLNDSEEIVYACNLLEEVLGTRLLTDIEDDPEVEFLIQFDSWVGQCKSTANNIFVFSLSEKPSLLSQWRSYTPHGKGVSIGFPSATLNEIAKNSQSRIAKCLYDKTEQIEILNSLIEKLLITFRKERPDNNSTLGNPETRYHSFLERFKGDVLQVLSIIKNQAFQEEQEWRLITKYYPSYVVPEIKFRKGASMLVPYVELDLGRSRPVFEKVLLGPSQHQNLSMSALSMFLSNKKLCNHTENCVIPYREW